MHKHKFGVIHDEEEATPDYGKPIACVGCAFSTCDCNNWLCLANENRVRRIRSDERFTTCPKFEKSVI